MPTLYDELRSLIDALERHDVDYALCGGMAMAIYGSPRATLDIDILIQEDALDFVFELAKGLGYTIRGRDLDFGPIQIRRVSKVDPETNELLTLDMLLVTNEIHDVWETRITAKLKDGKLIVVSRDGLITLKRRAGRPQDLADVAKLMEDNDASR